MPPFRLNAYRLRGRLSVVGAIMAPALYQQRVSECLQHARGLPDWREQAVWRDLALCWMRLADISWKFGSDAIDPMLRRNTQEKPPGDVMARSKEE